MSELELIAARSPRVEAIWRTLEREAAPAYFLTWGWIACWLDHLREPPPLAVLVDGGTPVAAGFLARRWAFQHHLLPGRELFLNTTGIPRYDELTIEHNGLLHVRPISLAALVGALPPGWDELVLPAIDADAFADLAEPAGCRVHVDRDVAAPYVDLERVRAAGYLALLHAGTRAQVRRARRGAGELAVEVAATVDEALDIYGELVALHVRAWLARGQPTALAEPWFDGFHRELIARRFAHGEIQLVRVRANGATLGCLYNLVGSGRVLFYQSGFAGTDDPHLKPGYVCHAAAIEHAAAAGHARYDFLAGEGRYKQSLATDEARMLWVRVHRRLARFSIEDKLRAWTRV